MQTGLTYRFQKISEIEKTLENERDKRKSLYKKYKRAENISDSIDTFLISSSAILAGVGIAIPVLLPVQIAAITCGSLGILIKGIRKKLSTKTQKHYKIKTIAESKLNSIKNLISKALTDSKIDENEFKLILNELEKYNEIKNKKYTNEVKVLNDNECDKIKKKLIEETEEKNELIKKL